MNEYNEAISELQRKISNHNLEINKIKSKIGNQITELNKENVQATPFFDFYNQALELINQIPQKKKMIQEIGKLASELADLQKKISEHKSVLAEREKAFKTIYEKIGNAAYNAFKQNKEEHINYENIFTELIKLDKKCEQFNKVAISENPDEKNIIRQVLDAAKSLYRNQKHKFFLLRYAGLYRQAGKMIQTTDYIEDADSAELKEALIPLLENEKAVIQLNKDIQKFESKRDEIQEKLTKLDIKTKPAKRIHEINSEIGRIEENLQDAYIAMADIFINKKFETEFDDPKLSEYIQGITELTDANHLYQKEIDRYETLIAIEKINQKIVKATSKMDHLKNLISKHEREIKSIQKDMSRLDMQKKSLQEKADKTN